MTTEQLDHLEQLVADFAHGLHAMADPTDKQLTSALAEGEEIIAAVPALIAAVREAQAAPAAPVTGSREGEALRPVYAPGGVPVTADEILKGMELALDRSYKMEGAEAYNYLYSTGQYTTQVLRKMLAAAPVVDAGPKWMPVGDDTPDETYLLVVVRDYVHPVIAFLADDGLWWELGEEEPMAEDGREVTHWMPLPALPAAPVTLEGETAQ